MKTKKGMPLKLKLVLLLVTPVILILILWGYVEDFFIKDSFGRQKN